MSNRYKPRYIIIHHSHTKDGITLDYAAIRKYHIEHNGWRDIGYNYVVENYGGNMVARKGRTIGDKGAHTVELGMNRKSVGVCIVGNFDLEPPSDEHLRMTAQLCMAIQVNWQIPVANILGHREVGEMAGYDWRVKGPTGIPQFKSCPGKRFSMGDLRELIWGSIDEL